MILNIIEELAATTKRKEKEAILLREKDNALLLRVFEAGLQPLRNYYIRKIPEYNPSRSLHVSNEPLEIAITQLGMLSSRLFTGHDAKKHLLNILESLPVPDAKIIEMIIAKDFRCGVSGSTVNKIWPNTIKEYPVMLATSSDAKLLSKLTFPVAVQTKFDGMRMNIIVDNGASECYEPKYNQDGLVEFCSRSGKPYDFLGHLVKEALELSGGGDWVFDGEMWVLDEKTGKPMPRKKGNGIIGKAGKGTLSEEEAKLIRMTIWDAIPLKAWEAGYLQVTYKDRLTILDQLFDNKTALPPFFKVVTTEANSLDEINQMFTEALSEEEEGIMVKTFDGHWEADRVKHQIKFKAEKSADLICVGWEKGTGRNSERIGKLICRTSDEKIEVRVGTGLTDADRDRDPNDYIDNIVEIIYNEKITSKGDKIDSLFLPRFICLRTDKSTANSSEELK